MNKSGFFVGFALISFLFVNTETYAQRNSNIGHYSIETECLGVEFDGSVTLRAWNGPQPL